MARTRSKAAHKRAREKAKARARKSTRQREDHVNQAERSMPTAQTSRNLTPDLISVMVQVNLLTQYAHAAAMEIHQVYKMLTLQSWAKTSKLQPMSVVRTSGSTADAMSSFYAEAHARRYLPWVEDTGQRVVDAVLSVVVDHHLRPFKATRKEFIAALEDYGRRMSSYDATIALED